MPSIPEVVVLMGNLICNHNRNGNGNSQSKTNVERDEKLNAKSTNCKKSPNKPPQNKAPSIKPRAKPLVASSSSSELRLKGKKIIVSDVNFAPGFPSTGEGQSSPKLVIHLPMILTLQRNDWWVSDVSTDRAVCFNNRNIDSSCFKLETSSQKLTQCKSTYRRDFDMFPFSMQNLESLSHVFEELGVFLPCNISKQTKANGRLAVLVYVVLIYSQMYNTFKQARYHVCRIMEL